MNNQAASIQKIQNQLPHRMKFRMLQKTSKEKALFDSEDRSHQAGITS